MWLSSADLSWCDLTVRFSLDILWGFLTTTWQHHLSPCVLRTSGAVCSEGDQNPKDTSSSMFYQRLPQLSIVIHTECNRVFCREVKTLMWIVLHFDCFFILNMIYLWQHFCQQTKPRRENWPRAAWVIFPIPSTEVAFLQHASDAFFCLPSRFHYVHPALLSVAHLSDPACSQHMFGLGLNQSTNRQNDGNIASCLEDSSCLPGRPPRSLSPTG